MQHALKVEMEERLRPFDLTATQYAVFSIVGHRDDMTFAALARRFAVTPQTMIKLIASLADQGLISRRVDADNRRALKVVVTTAGQRLARQKLTRRRESVRSVHCAGATPVSRTRLLASKQLHGVRIGSGHLWRRLEPGETVAPEIWPYALSKCGRRPRVRRSNSRKILTTHVGSLPDIGLAYGNEAALGQAIGDAVRKQKTIGIDIINEGEHTKGGDWLRYVETRLAGFEPEPEGATIINQGRDREEFADYYRQYEAALDAKVAAARRPRGRRNWVCTGPIAYSGEAALRRALAVFRAQLSGDEEAFVTTTAPGSFEPYRRNAYYRSHEEFLFALAEAMAAEYRLIAEAGFLVQVDDAWLAALWDRIGIGMGLEAFRRHCALRIEVLNHALAGIPTERVRYHLCWGSWHGPHKYDLPLKDIVDVLLTVNAGAYLIEAANPRHEHEFAVWESTRLPQDKILIPGVISHATPVIEHPELVAYRTERFCRLLGTENVIAGVDCGLGGRAHPQIGWAKLAALVEGARLASAQ